MKYILILLLSTISNYQLLANELNDIDTFQTLVTKWVNLKKEIVNEKLEWENQNQQLQYEYDLLKKEKDKLAKEISLLKTQNKTTIEKISKLKNEKNELEQEKQKISNAIKNSINDLTKWTNLIPKFSIPKNIKEILNLYKNLDNISYNIHYKRELIEQKEFQVLYFGLSIAYAISIDSQQAGYANYHDNKWNWNWDKKYNKSINKIISIFNNQKNFKLVNLPLQINKGNK